LFRDPPARCFSTNILWNRAAANGKLAAVIHDGDWYHIGTPGGLARAEFSLSTAAQKSATKTIHLC
jgi:MurNAc alpha-1-phosphate uridylyltransferase